MDLSYRLNGGRKKKRPRERGLYSETFSGRMRWSFWNLQRRISGAAGKEICCFPCGQVRQRMWSQLCFCRMKLLDLPCGRLTEIPCVSVLLVYVRRYETQGSEGSCSKLSSRKCAAKGSAICIFSVRIRRAEGSMNVME